MHVLADHPARRSAAAHVHPILNGDRAASTLTLTHRDRALLTAVDAGRCHVVSSNIPDLRVDGRWFCDQPRARALMAAGLLTGAAADSRGVVAARLTTAGRAAIGANPP
jgi:hypothetical protein